MSKVPTIAGGLRKNGPSAFSVSRNDPASAPSRPEVSAISSHNQAITTMSSCRIGKIAHFVRISTLKNSSPWELWLTGRKTASFLKINHGIGKIRDYPAFFRTTECPIAD
jgi:hypothetical protein